MNDRDKTSPAWRKQYPDGAVRYTRHAEAAALQLAERYGGKIKSVLVIRLDKKGNATMAKPCPDCMERLWKAGVRARDVQYTDWKGDVVEL